MSSPVRLLLLSGTPGADTGAVAAAARQEFSSSGRCVALSWTDATAFDEAYRSAWSMLAGGVGAILRGLGLASLSADEVGALPGLADLAVALAACEAAADADALVVWDGGPWESALRAVSSLGAAQVLLDRLLTPATTTRAQQEDGSAVQAVSAMRARLQAAEETLSASAVCWIVARPGPGAEAAVPRATAGLAVWEIPVDRVIDPAMSLEAALGGPALDRFSHGRGAMRWVEADADGYRLRIRLPMVDRESVRVGRSGPALVLGVDGWRRAIRLPSALQRCRVDGASLEDGVLTVRLHPDPQAWPEVASEEPDERA